MNEALKQQIMVTFVTFNFVFMLYQFLFNWGVTFEWWPDFFIGLILAGGAAAGAWFGFAKLR
jgi:hypothetical protein